MKTVAMRKAAKAKANTGGPGKGKKPKTPRRTVVKRPGKGDVTFASGEFEKKKDFNQALKSGAFTKSTVNGRTIYTYK